MLNFLAYDYIFHYYQFSLDFCLCNSHLKTYLWILNCRTRLTKPCSGWPLTWTSARSGRECSLTWQKPGGWLGWVLSGPVSCLSYGLFSCASLQVLSSIKCYKIKCKVKGSLHEKLKKMLKDCHNKTQYWIFREILSMKRGIFNFYCKNVISYWYCNYVPKTSSLFCF